MSVNIPVSAGEARTIPATPMERFEAEVMRHLEGMRVGQSLDLAALMPDELPDKATRDRALTHLQLHERQLQCIVDPKSGLIFKVSKRASVRFAAAIWPLVGAALGWLVLFGAGQISALSAAHLDGTSVVTEAYLVVLAGAVLHVIVAAQKITDVGVLPFSRGLDWLQLRWAAIGWTIVTVMVTLVGMKASGVGVKDTSETMLLLSAGYMSSSVAGLFLTRLDSRAQAIAGDLEKKI